MLRLFLDPKMLKTLSAIAPDPTGMRSGGLVENGLVNRYDLSVNDDSLPGIEGSFNICSFWLVEACTRAARHYPHMLEHTRWKFEDLLSYGNHLGNARSQGEKVTSY